MKLTHVPEKNVTTKVSQDTNALKNNDKEKSLTNNNNNSLSSPKEKLPSNNDATSQLIQKEIDVITIESDDDKEEVN